MSVVVVRNMTLNVGDILDQAIRDALLEAAQTIAEEARESIRSRPKSGREYRRGGISWTASAPGEPPANVTGALADSITAQAEPNGASIVATNEIAHTMEFGTAGGKIAPRPFMVAAADAKRTEVETQIAAAVSSRVA